MNFKQFFLESWKIGAGFGVISRQKWTNLTRIGINVRQMELFTDLKRWCTNLKWFKKNLKQYYTSWKQL